MRHQSRTLALPVWGRYWLLGTPNVHPSFRDPNSFIAGEIHNRPEVWDRMSKDLANRAEIMGWINNMVSVHDYLQHFKGRYAGIA